MLQAQNPAPGKPQVRLWQAGESLGMVEAEGRASGRARMEPWAFVVLLMANCLVSAGVGWWAAGQRYSILAYHVSSMEAAVTTYWDRIRKRMRIEPIDGEMPRAAGPTLRTRGEVYRRAAELGMLMKR